MVKSSSQLSNPLSSLTASRNTVSELTSLAIAPNQVMRGWGCVGTAGEAIARLGSRPLIVGGETTLEVVEAPLNQVINRYQLAASQSTYTPDCCESSLLYLGEAVEKHQADFIIGVGGGKALDIAKLLAHQYHLPIVTIPTSAATCAAWTALANIYSSEGAFEYDVALSRCPDLLLLDYEIIVTAPQRTLIAGIGDAIAKWYEASVSSGNDPASLIIAAVQQARILRDILLQKSSLALAEPGSPVWQEVVDATVLLPGVIGGMGGARCRTVAAHAVHNGLTQIPAAHDALHGEKVAYGILVQLRIEEMLQGNQLALSARQQLLQFYEEIGLPQTLEDLGLEDATLGELQQAAEFACHPQSDIHRLPFPVSPEQLLAAMVSTTVV